MRVLALLGLVLQVAEGASSIYDFSVAKAGGSEVSLSNFKAPVTLIVNTASKCGFTAQYNGLQSLYTQFAGKLEILAFPCNGFFAQEPGDDASIQAFVKDTYGVTFNVFAKVEVNGPDSHPLFDYLKDMTSADPVGLASWAKPSPGRERDVQWNFSSTRARSVQTPPRPECRSPAHSPRARDARPYAEFLCVNGVPVKRFDFDVEPSALVGEIEKAIAAASAAQAHDEM